MKNVSKTVEVNNDVIRGLILAKGWSFQYVSEQIGTSASSVGRWSRGQTKVVNKELLKKFADLCGVDYKKLITKGKNKCVEVEQQKKEQMVLPSESESAEMGTQVMEMKEKQNKVIDKVYDICLDESHRIHISNSGVVITEEDGTKEEYWFNSYLTYKGERQIAQELNKVIVSVADTMYTLLKQEKEVLVSGVFQAMLVDIVDQYDYAESVDRDISAKETYNLIQYKPTKVEVATENVQEEMPFPEACKKAESSEEITPMKEVILKEIESFSVYDCAELLLAIKEIKERKDI